MKRTTEFRCSAPQYFRRMARVSLAYSDRVTMGRDIAMPVPIPRDAWEFPVVPDDGANQAGIAGWVGRIARWVRANCDGRTEDVG